MASMFRYLSQELVKNMIRRGVVVLSPHFDDGCFSLGAFLSRIGTGELLNVFSRSVYAPGHASQDLTEAQVYEVRTAEDRAFANEVGMTRLELGGGEPDIWGRRPNDLSGLHADIQSMKRPVLDALSTRASSQAKPYLLVPMACGHHVQHHAVHEIIRNDFANLKKAFHVGFYEDLPYAHVPAARYRALKRFKFDFPDFERYIIAVDWKHKKKLIQIYASQLRRSPHPLKFRPASLWPLGIHEAVWFSPDETKAKE